MYEYRAEITKIYDADTIRVDVDLGFGVWWCDVPLRLYGLNAPEMSTEQGRAARDYLRKAMPVGTEVVINTIKDKKEKYGRYLAVVWLRGENINETLVQLGHAKVWDGVGERP